jgi:hypothetical protein
MKDRAAALEQWITSTHAVQQAMIDRGERKSLIAPEELVSAWDQYVPELDEYFEFYRPPLIHQIRDFYRFRDLPYHALFYQQRARKTKVELDIFRYLYDTGKVDALIIIAYPNGVHRVWIDELPKDFPPAFLKNTRAIAWASGKMTKGDRREESLALRDHDGPAVLTLNCEALITDTGWKYIEWFIKRRRVMMVADESSWAARWSARTKKLRALGRRPNVRVRSILDGTPVDEGPTDIFYPTNFLSHGLLGYTSMVAFKNRYLAYKTDEEGNRVKGYNRKTNTEYDLVDGVQNLDELHDKLQTFSSRVLRSEVSDAPAKTYQKRYFQLTERQRKTYNRLRDEYIVELSRGEVTKADVLARITRLQMVARNFYPPEQSGAVCSTCLAAGQIDDVDCPTCEGLGYVVEWSRLERIDDRNPAAEALVREAQATGGPMVTWCRFRQDVVDASDALQDLGRRVVRYYGAMPEVEREAAYQGFKAGKYDDIVGTIKSGLSRGKDLTRALCLTYYSNEPGLRARGQSEDRAEGLDRNFSTGIVDLVAEDTIDERWIELLRSKKSLAEVITGDPLSLWI